MTWLIKFRPSAEKQLDALDPPNGARVRAALLRLTADPLQATNVKAMHDGTFRLRVGDWRVVYALHDDVLIVLVLRIGHRREVYR